MGTRIMSVCLTVEEQEIGDGCPCFIVAEVGQAHDGSLGSAHALVDAIARSGANAVKFQTHIAAAESTTAEPFRTATWRQDATRYDYWKRMEFTEEQWRELAVHVRRLGLVFLSSPFSLAAVELLERVGMPAWKVPSGEITNTPLLRRLASTRAPVLLSTGLATWQEIDTAVEILSTARSPVALYQCTTSYPCRPEDLGLNLLGEMRRRYRCPVGLSDHSGCVAAGLAAVTLGANLLEVHVTLSREAFGPDVSSSLTTTELTNLVNGVRFIERAVARPVDKENAVAEAAELRYIFGKGIVASRDLPSGHRLAASDLCLKKPANGIPAARWDSVIGRRLICGVAADSPIEDQN